MDGSWMVHGSIGWISWSTHFFFLPSFCAEDQTATLSSRMGTNGASFRRYSFKARKMVKITFLSKFVEFLVQNR